MALTEEFVGDILTVKIATGEATISRIQRIKNGAAVVSERFMGHAAVEATGQWSLAGILTEIQASTLSGNTALLQQVEGLTAGKEALTVALAELQAKYDLVAPSATVSAKHVRIALDKLDLAKAWSAAVEATIATLDEAKNPDPKYVYAWWYEVAEIDPAGAEWVLIASEMDKAGSWAESSEEALLTLVAEVGAGTPKSDKPNGK